MRGFVDRRGHLHHIRTSRALQPRQTSVAISTPNEASVEIEARRRVLPTSLAAIAALIGALALVLQRAGASNPEEDDPFPLGHAELALGGGDISSAEPSAPRLGAAQLSFPELLAETDQQTDSLMPAELMARVPAALAAVSAGRWNPRSIKEDPLIAAAMRVPASRRPAAPEGYAGEFTLHVISYERVEHARAFAAGLRARGHAAFVVSADVPGRGRSFRVRIGPFRSRQQADAYRHQFEADEQMNTLVMRETRPAQVKQP
jgi:cell division septation protein DedD